MKVDYSKINKILVVQFRPFGDVLLATSYLEALKNKFPRAKIDFLLKKPYREILDKNRYLSEIISFPGEQGITNFFRRFKLLIDIRRRKYDLIIDQQSGTGSAQVILFSGAKYRLGWMNNRWKMIYNLRSIKGPVRYRASQNFDMLSPFGIKERPYEFFYNIRQESNEYIQNWLKKHLLQEKEMICLSPGSPRPKKKWNIQNYTKLVDLIMEKTTYTVAILWASNELEDAKKIISETNNKPILAPPTNFNQAAAFLKKCKLLVCNDGGINHLAVAVKIPSLAIFGNTNPKIWSPEGVFPHHYHLHNPNWKQTPNDSFGITPEEVFSKVEQILKEI